MTADPWLDTSWLDEYKGLSVDEALMLAQRQQRAFRVVRPDSAITTDLNKQRLNIHLDHDGALLGFSAS